MCIGALAEVCSLTTLHSLVVVVVHVLVVVSVLVIIITN